MANGTALLGHRGPDDPGDRQCPPRPEADREEQVVRGVRPLPGPAVSRRFGLLGAPHPHTNRRKQITVGNAKARKRPGRARTVGATGAVVFEPGEPSHRPGVDIKVILTPPCIFCMENHL